jgi:hypothetical protein
VTTLPARDQLTKRVAVTDYPIVRLQVQRSPLRTGRAPMRSYDPASLASVTSIRVDSRGAYGITADGEVIMDVHHQDHPQTRDPKGRAGVLFIGTGDYRVLRKRYGDHVIDGMAGETMLVDAPDGLASLDMPDTVTVLTADGPLELHGIRDAAPCVEFSRYCLREAPSPVVDDAVRQALIDLDYGSRGYRAIASRVATVAIGDLLRI